MERICYRCTQKNPSGATFCSGCGSPLALTDYIARQVNERLTESTRERELVETESAIRIFERSWGWAKLVLAVAGGVVALLVAGATYESISFRDTVKTAVVSVGSLKGSAERSITDTANAAGITVSGQASKSVTDIRSAANNAQASSLSAQRTAKEQGATVTRQTDLLRNDLQAQAARVTQDTAKAREQIQAASQLQPQMASLQQQLETAQAEIKEQQQVLTSSEDFAKKIFASHRQIIWNRATADKALYAVVPSPQAKGTPIQDALGFYLLLPETPVAATLQIQFNQTVAAPGSYSVVHNLLILYLAKFGEDELLGKPVSVAYFPDPSDKNIMHHLEVKDGRVFGDGEALPKFGTQPDYDFKGSKWFPVPIVSDQPVVAVPAPQAK